MMRVLRHEDGQGSNKGLHHSGIEFRGSQVKKKTLWKPGCHTNSKIDFELKFDIEQNSNSNSIFLIPMDSARILQYPNIAKVELLIAQPLFKNY